MDRCAYPLTRSSGRPPQNGAEYRWSISSLLVVVIFSILMRLETSERDCFVRLDVKDGEEPRNLDNIADILREIQELHFSACFTDCHIGGDKLADPGAIDIIDIGEIE